MEKIIEGHLESVSTIKSTKLATYFDWNYQSGIVYLYRDLTPDLPADELLKYLEAGNATEESVEIPIKFIQLLVDAKNSGFYGDHTIPYSVNISYDDACKMLEEYKSVLFDMDEMADQIQEKVTRTLDYIKSVHASKVANKEISARVFEMWIKEWNIRFDALEEEACWQQTVTSPVHK